jgi:hypothetical protein
MSNDVAKRGERQCRKNVSATGEKFSLSNRYFLGLPSQLMAICALLCSNLCPSRQIQQFSETLTVQSPPLVG